MAFVDDDDDNKIFFISTMVEIIPNLLKILAYLLSNMNDLKKTVSKEAFHFISSFLFHDLP